jgi:hypothetical protein
MLPLTMQSENLINGGTTTSTPFSIVHFKQTASFFEIIQSSTSSNSCDECCQSDERRLRWCQNPLMPGARYAL